MGKETLLKEFLDNIYKEINPASFHAWFNDLEIINLTNDKITFKVPMEIHKKMLGDNYYSLIDKTLTNITNINYDIEFILESDIKETLEEVVNNPQVIINNLETNLNPNLNFDNFVVGDTNRLAKVAAMAVAEAPGRIHNPLFIYGKSGLGKTHLMHAIGNFIIANSNRKVLYCTCDEFMTEYTNIANPDNAKNTVEYANDFKNKYRNVDVLIIDDIQYLVGAEKTQQEFFNTFNYLHQSNKQIIISSDRSPEDLKILEERLRSRFMWGLPVDIYPPDFDLRCRIIRKKIENTSIANLIKEESIEYIANACQNDIRFLEGAVNRLMAYTAMIVPKTIDLEFTCEALKDFVNKNIYSNNNITKIQKAVADHYNITVDDLKGKKRSNKVAHPRQLAMYLCRMETDETFPRIGLEFGGRDHSTVIFACDKIEQELLTNHELERAIKEIKAKL
ncbi:chromosomal replication initiator protein DnaA [Mycoplasma sp. CAG:776]|nr:chromosomal replication initiator protein DnaA [Mycoplasma sp. CAG:776]